MYNDARFFDILTIVPNNVRSRDDDGGGKIFLLREWWLVLGGELIVGESIFGYFESEENARGIFGGSIDYRYIGTSEEDACNAISEALWANEGHLVTGLEVFELLDLDELKDRDEDDPFNREFIRHLYISLASLLKPEYVSSV